MFNHYYTIRAVVGELRARLEGAMISEIYTQEKDEVLLQCNLPGAEHHLLFSCDSRLFRLHLRRSFQRARKNSLDVFPDAVGHVISEIGISPVERLVTITLDDGRTIRAALIPGRANLYFHDSEDNLLARFKAHPQQFTPRPYSYDGPVLESTVDEFCRRNPGSSMEEMVGRLFGFLGRDLRRELLFRARASYNAEVSESTTAGQAIDSSYASILEDLSTPAPRMYLDGEQPLAFSLIPFWHHQQDQSVTFGSISEGIEAYHRSVRKWNDHILIRRNLIESTEREIRRIEQSLDRMDLPEVLRSRAERYERYGFLLLSVPTEAGHGQDRVTIPDIFGDGKTAVEIPLQPRLSFVENAERFFRKAKQCKSSISHTEHRIVALQSRYRKLKEIRTGIDNCFDYSSLKEYIADHAEELTRLRVQTLKERQQPRSAFRRFTVAGGFEVWAGKSGADNDDLTMHHSDKNDLWFHARGSGGSHVILKIRSAAGEVPKEAILDAASIAAYYSKQRRAKLVPVAYTLRKYVRKPKGSSIGSVMIEREKVVHVRPALPAYREVTDEHPEENV